MRAKLIFLMNWRSMKNLIVALSSTTDIRNTTDSRIRQMLNLPFQVPTDQRSLMLQQQRPKFQEGTLFIIDAHFQVENLRTQ